MFRSVLVANRGEIAVRICRTLRAMGISSVVAASIPDRHSLAVRRADASVLLEGYSAAESYLDVGAIIAAAKAEGCDAIHPGYGFLSERADFAERCTTEGIVFIGPPPSVLRALGDKSAARRLAASAGVPTVPGWDGADDDASLLEAAAAIGYPVMVKARGGGGGRGMRVVRAAEELPEAIASARREAEAAFGDPGLLLERLVQRAHHVEVQVLADAHGNIVHLGERDCSVQRRRQKLIEETPSPIVDAALRAELTAAALALARAVGYVNAGTVEFLVAEPGPDGKRPFYFLEVNPRLQVEHPVTEMVTGLDLVELQVRIAAGEALPFRQEDITFAGHAIEFRINAENPWHDFRPATGRIRTLEQGTGIVARVDAGYAAGDRVPAQYDSLLAKTILRAANRDEAISRATPLLQTQVQGLSTNGRLLSAVAASEDFRAGHATIDWLESRLDDLLISANPTDVELAEAAAGVAVQSATTRSPWDGAAWFGAGQRTVWLSDGSRTWDASVARGGDGSFRARAGDSLVEIDGDAIGTGATAPAAAGGFGLFAAPPPPLPRRAVAVAAGASAVVAPLAGTIAAVLVAEGDEVEAGQLLATLEAMKMEHRVTASASGKVARVAVQAGDVVAENDVLVELG